MATPMSAVFSAGEGLALGDFYRLRVPGYRIHVVTDPAAIEQILVTDSSSFEKSRIYWRELRRMIGDAMGSIEGMGWDYLRRLQSPLFTPKAIQGYLPLYVPGVGLRLKNCRWHYRSLDFGVLPNLDRRYP